MELRAEEFWQQLREVEGAQTARRYEVLRSVFYHAVEERLRGCQLSFIGMFAKVDYLMKECHVPDDEARQIHSTRHNLFPRQNQTTNASETEFPHDIKAVCLLLSRLFDEDIPEDLYAMFPTSVRTVKWGSYDERVLRVIVESWDEQYITCIDDRNVSTLRVDYSTDNRYLTRNGEIDWSYLAQILRKGCQLNLLRVRMEDEVCMPELIIFEPDYLINITTIASCFETYAESPYVHLVNKLKPQESTLPIHLGNLAGQFLDQTVHGVKSNFNEDFMQFFRQNALSLVACADMHDSGKRTEFYENARRQKENIERLIGEELPQVVGGYDQKRVVLEPSFFSSALGMQGRLDFLYQDDEGSVIVEQKSGKGAFVPNSDPDVPAIQEKHWVQLVLYRALFIYEFGQQSSHVRHIMLLYSKYRKGLISTAQSPDLLYRAVRMRNLLAWCEFQYAYEGMSLLASLTPDKLNKKKLQGKFWQSYIEPQLRQVLLPIHQATPLERAYYLRFLRFLSLEQMLSKVGNRVKECSGFASVWLDSLESKRSAGNIYDGLTIVDLEGDGDAVSRVRLRFSYEQDADTSNFRTGDIVILYPYQQGMVPDACAQMVVRCSIEDITSSDVTLRLRNQQGREFIVHSSKFKVQSSRFKVTSPLAPHPATPIMRPGSMSPPLAPLPVTPKVECHDARFTMNYELCTMNLERGAVLWALEHDMFESSSSSLFSGMHSFLSAPIDRRQLLLSQRKPEIDETVELKGEYGPFNELVLHARQSRDYFLVIGPPGTGKTSFGLLNILQEELLHEGTNVLLLSFTNRAVDEICEKLVESDIDFMRIGSELGCSPEYRSHLLANRLETCRKGDEVQAMIGSTRVFCGTTASLGANMDLLRIKHFDLAIVDESSQILEPHLVGLFSAWFGAGCAIDRFVLIGDHKQLPAVVQQTEEESAVTDEELLKIGLKNCRLSLFERLLAGFRTADGGYDPHHVYMLRKQGRMHAEIAEFPNHAFYESKLDVVPLKHQLAESEDRRVVFIDVVPPRSQTETAVLSDKVNQAEADVVAREVVRIYNKVGKDFSVEHTIGVIVPYRNQISTIRNAIDRYGISELHNITIDTVERYQGSQRDYILYGFTVQRPYQLNFLTSNVFEENGHLIDRRLNVAMTRARLHLIIIGNAQLLRRDPVFRKLIEKFIVQSSKLTMNYEL